MNPEVGQNAGKNPRGTYCYQIIQQTPLLQRSGRPVHRNHTYNGSEIFWTQKVGCHNDGLTKKQL